MKRYMYSELYRDMYETLDGEYVDADIAQELYDALVGLDEAYCRAGSGLTREERFEDRKRLMNARKAIEKADKD